MNKLTNEQQLKIIEIHSKSKYNKKQKPSTRNLQIKIKTVKLPFVKHENKTYT